MRRTKIICTLGPSSSSKEMIIKLINKGMNVARLNFSHGTHEEHRRVIRLLKEVREEKKRPVGILLDTKGPELRVGLIEDMVLKAGQVIRLGVDVPIFPEFVAKEVEIGKTVYFDDGYIKGTIVGRGGGAD